MGVKWLTSFVKDVERIVSSQVSFDVVGEGKASKPGPKPTFVVDAWAFLYHIWLNHFGDSIRGLDYEAYQATVQSLIRAWASVGITTVFVFDGPFLPAKLPKIIERKAGVAATNSAYMKSSPASRTSRRFQVECGIMAPLLLQALIGAIEKMGSDQVEMIFAPTEADSLVAEIATEKEQGYAISLDSDFFILCARGRGCQYVPLDAIEYLVIIPAPEQGINEAQQNENDADVMDGFEQVGKRKRGAKKNAFKYATEPISSTSISQQTRVIPPSTSSQEKLSSVRIRAHRSHDLASHLQIPSNLLPLLAALVGNDYTTTLQSNTLFRNLQGPQRITEAASILRSEWMRVTKESKIGLREATKTASNTRKGSSRLQMTMSTNDNFDDGKSDTFSSPSSATATPTRNTPTPYQSSKLAQHQDPVRAMVQIIVDKSLDQADAGFSNPRYVPTGEKDLIVESVIDSIATYSLLTHSDAPHLASPSALFFGHPSSLMISDNSEKIASHEAIERYRQAYAQGHFKPALIEAMTQRVFLSSLSAEDADIKSIQTLAARELRHWLWSILFEVWGMSWAREEWEEPAFAAAGDELDDSMEIEEEQKVKAFLATDKGYRDGERPDDVISVNTESSNENLPEEEEQEGQGKEMENLPSRPGSVAEMRTKVSKPAPGITEYVRKGHLFVGELVQIIPLLNSLNGDLIEDGTKGKIELPPSLSQLRGQHEAAIAAQEQYEANHIGNERHDQPAASDPTPPAVAIMSLGTRLDLYLHAHRSCTPLIQSLPRNWWSIAAILRFSILNEADRLGPAKKKLNWTRGELIAAIQSACYHSYRSSIKEVELQESIKEILPSTRAIHLGSTLQLLLETSYLISQSLMLPVDVKDWIRPQLLYNGITFHYKMNESASKDVQILEKSLRKQEKAILDAVINGLEDDLGIDVSELRRERKAKKKEAKAQAEEIEKGSLTNNNRSMDRAKQAARNNFALLADAIE